MRLKRMLSHAPSILLSLLWFCLFCGPPAFGQEAGRTEPPPAFSKEEIRSVIEVLEDPAAREKLIRQLEILSRTEPEKTEIGLGNAASRMLASISEQLRTVSGAFREIGLKIHRLPEGIDWLRNQYRASDNRAFWIEIFIRIGFIVALGHAIFYLSRLFFRRARHSLAKENLEYSFWSKVFRLFGRLMLDLMPITLFAAGVYATLSLLPPEETIRLLVLAWTHAFVIHHLVIIASRLVLAAKAPELRLTRFSDEGARHLEQWTRRFSSLIIYGYTALQAGLILGMETSFYEGLMRVFGLLILLTAIIFIYQDRKRVGNHIRSFGQHRTGETRPFLGPTLEQAARLWHIPVVLYLILFYGVWALKTPGGAMFLLKATVWSLLAVAAGVALLRGLRSHVSRGIRFGDSLKIRFSGLEERTNKYLSAGFKGIRLLVIALVVLAVLEAWSVDAFAWLSGELGRMLVGTFFSVVGILVVAFLVWEIANTYIEHYLNAKTSDGLTQIYNARARTLMSVIRKALLITIIVITSLTVLSELGIDIAPLLAGAGVLGLAIGFGAQKLVQDVITGVFILLEDQISEGDVVNVGGKAGVVESVDIRTLRLRDLSGTVHTLPYSAIDSVSNMTKEFSFYVFDVGIAYREDVDHVMAVLREIGADLQADPEYGAVILDPLEILGVDAFADSAVVIKARFKTAPIKQWWVGREFNRRMKKKFDELDIEIPFPHQTLYFGVDKEGKAPPARFRISPEEKGIA